MSASRTTQRELLSLLARIAAAYEEKWRGTEMGESDGDLYEEIIETIGEAEDEQVS